MQDMLENLSTYGYIVLFLYSIGGGMVAIIAAGVLSHIGKMDLYLSIGIATFANALGDFILFYLARYNKASVMPYFKGQTRKLAYANMLMRRHGDKMIFIQKYIYGVKTLVPLAIGLTKYPMHKFSLLNIIAAIIWAFVLGFLSFYAGKFVVGIGDYFGSNSWIMPVFIILLLGGMWLFLEAKTKKRLNKLKDKK